MSERTRSDGKRTDGKGTDGKGTADRPGYELPLLLFAGFRTLIDRLHAELARQGHPDVRPAHGFAMQAIGPDGATASEVGRRLGVSKQAAGKTVDRLITLGYAARTEDPADARRKLVRLTPHGIDALRRSATVFDELRAEWAASWARTTWPTWSRPSARSYRRTRSASTRRGGWAARDRT